MAVVDLHLGILSIEVIGGEPRDPHRLTFREAGEAVPAPAGTWTLRGGNGGDVVVPIAADGDDLLITFTPELTALIVNTPLRLRLDGATKARGRWLDAQAQETPRSTTTTVTLLGETETTIDMTIAAEGQPGPAGPGLPTGGTEGQAPLRTAGASPETEWGDVVTPTDMAGAIEVETDRATAAEGELATALAGKADDTHAASHAEAGTDPVTVTLAQLAQSGATLDQIPAWNGTGYVPVDPPSGGGVEHAPVLELIPRTAYGDSFLMGTGHTASAGFVERVGSRLRMGALTNRGASSYQACDGDILAFGTAAGFWTTPTTPNVVFVNLGVNDLARQADSAQKRAAFSNALRHLLWVISAGSRINDVTGTTTTGTWSTLTSTVFSGGSRRGTSTVGATVDFPFTGDAIVLTLLGLDDAEVSPGGATVQITDVATATVLATVDTSNQGKKSLAVTANTWSNMAVHLDGFGPGSHTVRLTNQGATTRFLLIDDALIPSSTPPTIVVNHVTYLAAVGYSTNGSHANDALVDTYNGLIDGIAADFSNVVVAECNDGWDPATMTHSDGVHPNDRGSAHIADAIEVVLRPLDWRNGLNTLAVP